MHSAMGGSRRWGLWLSYPDLAKPALGTWIIMTTLWWGKEPELVHQVERYQLGTAGLILMHGVGSRISPSGGFKGVFPGMPGTSKRRWIDR